MSSINRDGFLDLNEHLNLINPVMRPDQVRAGDQISCNPKVPGIFGGPVKVWSYCPFGFELDVDHANVDSSTGILEFELILGKNVFDVSGTVVYERYNEVSGRKLVGIRTFHEAGNSSAQDGEKRKSFRWNCPEHLLPTGTASNPIRYNDFIFFRVVDISSNGLRIATSLRNKFLAIGQILEATLSVPMIGSLSVPMQISRCSVETMNGKEYLVLGVSLLHADEIVLSTLSEYLLTFAEGCSVHSLRAAGFQVKSNSSFFDFSYVKSQKDYDEVLQLRFDAYKESGKLADGTTKEFMRDEYDSRARILVVRSQGKIVGSARAMFHDSGDRTSHERYLEYPKGFPEISDCLEVSRVCVSPEFQGIGLAAELANHLALLTVKSGRRYCYLSAAQGLIEFWKRLGYRETGVTYVHEALGNLEHKLLINPIAESILGRSISASNWEIAYSNLYEYCLEFGLVEPTSLELLKLKFRRIFKGDKRAGS